MADIAAVLLFAGLVMARAENLPESVFFLAVISFIVILLLRLIDDIDNPFGLSDVNSAENVSIELLEKAVERLRAGAKKIYWFEGAPGGHCMEYSTCCGKGISMLLSRNARQIA